MKYNIPRWKKGLRIAAQVVGDLACAAIAVGAVVVLMTPGVNLVAAGAMISIMFVAMGAFLYLHSTATTTTTVGGPGFTSTFNVPVPSTAGLFTAGIPAACLFHKKSRIASPVREETAENNRIATVNYLADALKRKITLSIQAVEVKQFLLDVVNKADKMFNEGARGWFFESRDSKMKKATLILRELAKILERSTPQTINEILDMRLNGHHRFSDLLNAQRNNIKFWKTAATFCSLTADKTGFAKPRKMQFDQLAAILSNR